MDHNRMKSTLLILTATLLLTGCRSHSTALTSTESHTIESDSVMIVESIVYVTDAVYVNIPSQRETTVVPIDSTSTLENDYAISIAGITPEGLLWHSLCTKPQVIAADFLRPEKTVEKSQTHTRFEQDKETVTVEVERKLTWWQRFRLSAFWWLLGALALSGGWIFRRPLLQLLTRLSHHVIR